MLREGHLSYITEGGAGDGEGERMERRAETAKL